MLSTFHGSTLAVAIAFFLLCFGQPACHRQKAPDAADANNVDPALTQPALSEQNGLATWYDVPEGSLPERMAPNALTAASNTLPMKTVVRVTNLSNQRKTIVHITDNGIRSNSDIDLCKEAAEQLRMVKKGVTKVRIEVLSRPDKPAVTPETSQ